jgi:hypothetical protein
VHAGQASDLAAAPALLDSVRVPGARGAPRRYPDALAGDKAYSFGPMRRWCRRHRVAPVLPRRDDQPHVRRGPWTAHHRRRYRSATSSSARSGT